MLQRDNELSYCQRNIKNYEKISYLNATILIWGVMTLYYNYRGLTFFEISLIQSIGAAVTIILEIPSGWISDRYGHAFVLRISALCNVIAVLFLIFSDSFLFFLIAEIFSAVASAAQSGADTALFYDSLTKIGKKEEYSVIRAKIRGRQSLIRIASRFTAPLIFSVFSVLPFVLSGVIYLMISGLTFRYMTPIVDESSVKKDNNSGKFSRGNIFAAIIKHKSFILYSILSAFILVSVSNYSQYVSPFLVERGLDIKWLGIILAVASIGDFVGTKFIHVLKKGKSNYVLLLLAILISGFVVVGGMSNTIIGGAIGYFGINMMYSPFAILLGESVNKVIDNKYRATLLSISNQFDEIFGIMMDPIIGVAIDLSGFRMVYIWMGIISIFFLMLASFFIVRKGKDR